MKDLETWVWGLFVGAVAGYVGAVYSYWLLSFYVPGFGK
jgi:hypothetical protein